ncbi:hypothetical protein [Streptomyces sp. SID3343]|uniref:hypothetical protein n=1 Tax=Streptomyces sp. SID3343 TaxID=2690260 RepID=UPI00136BC0A5|nr:hypothetical protein [Streptomyces sp. SID3343]MYW03647.1 hypothetical protein [Streptomyces sp. SID3343]
MRVRKAMTAGVLAIGPAVAAGIGAPAAQAASDTTAISSTAATASGGFLSCTDPLPLYNDPNSKATACISVYGGQVTVFGSVTFHSLNPAQWTACYAGIYLTSFASGGAPTNVGGTTAVDCTGQGRGSGTVSFNWSAPAEVGKTYRAELGMIAEYNGQGVWGNVAETSKFTVLN